MNTRIVGQRGIDDDKIKVSVVNHPFCRTDAGGRTDRIAGRFGKQSVDSFAEFFACRNHKKAVYPFFQAHPNLLICGQLVWLQ